MAATPQFSIAGPEVSGRSETFGKGTGFSLLAGALLVRGPGLEREEPKGKEVQARKDNEEAPNWMMTSATKEFCDRHDEKEKYSNEQHNNRVSVRVERP